MSIKGIQLRVLPDSFRYEGVTLFPFILTKKNVSERLINHERIHIAQQQELLVIPFYLLYVLWHLYGLTVWKSHREAYLNNPFEVEAYENQENMNYLKNRRPFTYFL